MASKVSNPEYLKKKHRMFFKYLDLNADGKLFRSDILKRVEKISTLNVANEEESSSTRKIWTQWCDMAFPSIDAEKGVTEDEFVERIVSILSSGDRQNFVDVTEGLYQHLFDRLDANRDGRISRDELKTYYGSIGSADGKFVDRVFRKLHEKKDGLISKSELVTAGVAFWASEDTTLGFEIMYDAHN